MIGVVLGLGLGLPARAAVRKRYPSCTKLVAVYPKGVARAGAADMVHARQQGATGYVVDTKLYTLNEPLDIDGDGNACEPLAAAVQPVVPPVPDAEPSTAVRPTQPPPQPTVPPPTAPPPATAPPITSTQPTAPPQPVTSAPLQTTPGPVLQRFRNCAEVNAVYPHGVGRSGAVDSTSGTASHHVPGRRCLYLAQPGTLDRDNDGIACEKP